MSDIEEQAVARMRRSLGMEVNRLEDDFDKTRSQRAEIADKLMHEVRNIKLTNEAGQVDDSTSTKLQVITTAMKVLVDTEKANVSAVGVKLRHNEQAMQAAAATKDRINVVIEATRPGRIENSFPKESLEETLAEMFDDSIKDFELKSNSRDLESDQ